MNVNDYIKLKLNQKGLNILRDRHDELRRAVPKYDRNWTPPNTDANGYSRFQLWEAMQIFGPHITMGMEPPFSTEVRFDNPA